MLNFKQGQKKTKAGFRCWSLSRQSPIPDVSTYLWHLRLPSSSSAIPSHYRLRCSRLDLSPRPPCWWQIRSGPSLSHLFYFRSLFTMYIYYALHWRLQCNNVFVIACMQRSGSVPGVGLVHAPVALFPTPFPENHWREACELAPIFNELVDRVSLDATFLHDSLSRLPPTCNFCTAVSFLYMFVHGLLLYFICHKAV